MGCIYMWTNQENKKRYIGKCHGNVMERYNAHIRGRGNQPLKDDIDEFGIENFTFEILHDGILDEFLDDYEKEAIAKYNTVSPNGYNQTWGGDGGKLSEITKAKISESLKGEQNFNYGRPRSEETKRKISEKHKGKKLPEEHRRKLSEAHKGNPSYMKGKKHSAEARRKMSQTRKGKPAWNKGMPLAEETKQQLSQTMKGRPSPCGFKGKSHSNQTRRKISEKLMSQERKDAREYYFNLPKSMSAKEKRKKVSEFIGKTPSKIWHWTKAWENGKL